MPRGLILSVLSASHQNSTTWRIHGSLNALVQPFLASTALSRLPNGFITSQLLFHKVQSEEFQSELGSMPPTKPYLTLPSPCNFLLSVPRGLQVRGSALSVIRSVR